MKMVLLALLLLVPLGDAVPQELRLQFKTQTPGPYWLVFLKPECLGTTQLSGLYKNLRNTNTPVLFATTEPMRIEDARAPMAALLNPNRALELAKKLRVYKLPTTILIDNQDRIRDSIEGEATATRLQTALGLLKP